MREILFRGKRLDSNEWIEGLIFYISKTSAQIINFDYDKIWTDLKTIGQYTGLTDKNGIKIFEGDIVEFLYDDLMICGKVFYSESETAFVVYYELSNQRLFIHSKTLGHCDSVKVIGNIYDNPELLEVENESIF